MSTETLNRLRGNIINPDSEESQSWSSIYRTQYQGRMGPKPILEEFNNLGPLAKSMFLRDPGSSDKSLLVKLKQLYTRTTDPKLIPTALHGAIVKCIVSHGGQRSDYN